MAHLPRQCYGAFFFHVHSRKWVLWRGSLRAEQRHYWQELGAFPTQVRKTHKGESSVGKGDDIGIVIEAKSGPFCIAGLFRQAYFSMIYRWLLCELCKEQTLEKPGIPGKVLFYDSSHALSSITKSCNISSPLPYLPPTTRLLSSLDTCPPDPNNGWQQSSRSSGHHLLALPPAPHICIPKGFGMRRPEFTRARIHLEPLKGNLCIWLKSMYLHSWLKPKNVPASNYYYCHYEQRDFLHTIAANATVNPACSLCAKGW